jgi:prepilin-type N-terminal cleavage/methylation domain-containing protein
MRPRRAFTLVEVTVVVGIVGVIMLVGIAPLVYSVRLMSDTRAAFAEGNRERSAVNRIALDARAVISLNGIATTRVIHRDELAGPRDYLLLWTITPSYSLEPMGTVIFGVPPGSVLAKEYEHGLYRWTLSDDKHPDAVTIDDNLTSERGRLVLRGVQGVRFSALKDSEWLGEYSGDMPQALRILLRYGDDKDREEMAYDIWMPRY